MKRALMVLLCVIMSVAFYGCGKKDEAASLEKIQKKLISMDTYSCVAQITQVSNKGEKSYEVTQDARKSGEYRIIVTSPEKIAGTVTVFNGTSTFQYNPRVSGSLKIDLPVSQVRNEILLTSFVKNYLNSEDVAVETSKQEGAVYTVLEAVIPGTNPYLKTEKLWVDNETYLPGKLVIYDESNTERIVVTYKEMEYNTKLGEEIFTISAEEAQKHSQKSSEPKTDSNTEANTEANAEEDFDAEWEANAEEDFGEELEANADEDVSADANKEKEAEPEAAPEE